MQTTLLKGLEVLELLVRSRTPLGVSTLAATLGLPKSNVHRTLSTLVEAGYAVQDQKGGYLPTLRLWELGVQVMSRHPLRRAAAPFMHRLHQETGETISLVILDGNDSLYLHQIASPMPIRLSSAVGERAPAILTVSGKTLLALSHDWDSRARRFHSELQESQVKLPQLLKELKRIRDDGYAMAASRWRPGVNSMAAVIVDENDRAVAAIAVAGARERFTDARMRAVLPALLNICTEIGSALGA